MAFYHFLDGRLDNRCLFRTDQSVVTGMRVQRENGNAGIVDTEILFQRLMEDFQFLHDQFLGQVRSNFPYRNVTGYQCHAEIAFQQNHQGLVAFPYPFFNIFGVSREMEDIRLDGMLVDRSRNQYVEYPFRVIVQRSFQGRQSCLSGLHGRFGQFHLQFLFRAIDDVQPSVLNIRRRIDDAEIGLNVHCLAMVCGHLGRTVYDRSA